MIKTLRRSSNVPFLGIALTFVLLIVAPARALEANDWKNRQLLSVEQTGVFKLTLPPATLDLARPGLEDLRLLDPAGREVPFIIEQSAATAPLTMRSPKSFRSALADNSTQLLIETGGTAALDAIILTTPATGFIKAARVEISSDGVTWEILSPGTAVFRQFGAEQLRLALDGRRAPHVRITIDDTRAAPLPFTGASIVLAPIAPAVITRPLDVRVVRREEFAGETLLTVDLGAAHVPLAAIEFVTLEPLFARNVTVTRRELREDSSVEQPLASDSIYRVAMEGLPPSARLEVPLNVTAPSREVFVHIANGDSPPLAIETVSAHQHPRWLIFRAAEPGAYAVLTGNAQSPAPHYDLIALAPALKSTPPSALVIGVPAANPGYRRPETLADTPLVGASLDPAAWIFRKPVNLTTDGVQELELDLDVLSRAQQNFPDLRLVRDGVQVPYLLERTALARSLPLTLEPANDPKRPHLSRWQIKLSREGFPLGRLTLTSSSPFFQRRVRILETLAENREGPRERVLAEASWIKTRGDAGAFTVALTVPPATAPFLEIDHQDNSPIPIAAASTTYPVTRLLFKTTTGPLALYYGNDRAAAPRYDLAIVAGQILSAEKSVATLGREEKARPDGWTEKALRGLKGGAIFWAVLALVVIALLAIVAKLLPKPTAT